MTREHSAPTNPHRAAATRDVDRSSDRTAERGAFDSASRRSFLRAAGAGAGALGASLATIAASTAPTGADTPPPQVELFLDRDELLPGETTQATLTLTEVLANLVGFTVEVRVEDPAVASIGEVAFSPEFELTQVLDEDPDGAWVVLDAVDLQGDVVAGDQHVEFATLEVVAEDVGQVDVDVTIEYLTDAEERQMDAVGSSDVLDVSRDNWQGELEVDGEPIEPRDLDGDGLYRDVDGDGEVAQSDVVAFFENQHRDVVDAHAELFDYTGNGDAGHGDVVELFEYVVTG